MGLETTVFVVEDDALMRRLLALEVESAGYRAEQFASAEDFLTQYSGDNCSCILLDMQLSGMNGLDLLEMLRARHQLTPVIVISAYGSVNTAVRSMKLGAVDFLEKPFDHTALVEKLKAAVEQYQAARAESAEADAIRQRLATLTPREMELLVAVSQGKPTKTIARELGISERTVEKHRANLLAKTGASNAAGLARMQMIAKMT